MSKGVDKDFIIENLVFVVVVPLLPGSSLATANIDGNFMGVQEKMAHSRIYTQLDLEFYVDRDYKMINYLIVGWIILQMDQKMIILYKQSKLLLIE